MIGRTLAHYRVTAAIGAGGMGEVYRATDTKLGRDVAIKVLPAAVAQDRERLTRFRREAQLLASLNHPNIAAIYGLEESDGQLLLVLELVEGHDLAALIAGQPLGLADALPIARQIADALEAAHDQGIVHRDLKPANVKVTPSGKVKVLDFGLAKAWTGDASGSQADVSQSPTLAYSGTAAGVILGTAAYMSPEQARGKFVDKKTDIWAFGVVLWEMLTGRRLFSGETVSDVIASVLTNEPDWTRLPPMPRSVSDMLRRCLAKDPRVRLHDIADARIVLDEAAAGDEDEVLGPALQGRGMTSRWQTLLLASVGILALAAAGLGWALTRGRSPAPATPRNLSVILPDSVWLVDDLACTVAISPDGDRLVIVAANGDAQRLYLRELGSPDLRPLPGTDNASCPFFSPDGHWIGFSRNGFYKLSLDGGEPVQLAPRIFGVGAWSPTGEIYFTPDYNAGLDRISAAGGAPEELTHPGKDELNHSFPELLPGGKALLFTSHRATVAGSRVEALSLVTGERHVVIEEAIEGRYLNSGHLVFVRDEALMVAPFDLATLRLTGPVLPARTRVAVEYAAAHAEYALSANGTLVLVPRNVMPARQEVVRLDRAGRAETVLAAEKTYDGPALSPDGRQLALTRNERGPDLMLYDLEHKSMTRLAASPRREFGAVWDRSGTRIFFAVDLPIFQIFEIAADGSGEPKRLVEGTVDQLPQDVSPDGRSLLYLQNIDLSYRALGLLPLDRPAQARLLRWTESDVNHGCFSPDGRFIAFESNESGRAEVYVRALSGAAQSVPVSRAGGQRPRWAAHGDLFFWQGDQIFAVPVRTAPLLQVGEPKALFRTAHLSRSGFFETDYDVSADGQSIYLARTPDLLRPREIRVVSDWASEVTALVARGSGS